MLNSFAAGAAKRATASRSTTADTTCGYPAIGLIVERQQAVQPLP